MPPPTTSMRSGIGSSSSAPVESTIRGIVRQSRQHCRFGPRGNNAMLEADRFTGVEFEMMRRRKRGLALNHPHLALFCEVLETSGQSFDDLVFPVTKSVGIDFRLAEADTVIRHCFCIVNDLGGVQQCFRGDTTDVEADTAQHRPAFDEDDVQSEIGATKWPRYNRRVRRQSLRAGHDASSPGFPACEAAACNAQLLLFIRLDDHR